MQDNSWSMSALASQVQTGGMSQKAFATRVVPMFTLGLLMTGASAWLTWGRVSLPFLLLAALGTIILIFTAGSWQRNEKIASGMFFLMAALCGVTMVPLLMYAKVVGGGMLIFQALATTSVAFGGLVAYGATTKRDFSYLGGFLIMTLLGIIVAGIINMFLGSGFLAMGINMITVVTFSGFVLYDMAQIRQTYADDDYMMAALALYLDFINLFQAILRILMSFAGVGRSDD